MKTMIFFIFILFSINIFPKVEKQEEYIEARILYLQKIIKKENDKELGIKKIEVYKAKLLNGNEKGKEIIIESPIYFEKAYNLFVRVNQKIIVCRENGSYYIIDIDRRDSILEIIGLFIILTIIIAKLKGVKAIFSLFIVILIIYKIFFPLITKGYSPILVSTCCALVSSIITIFFGTGISKKGIVAILGAVIGVLGAGIVSMYFSYKMAMTGFLTVESLNYSDILKNIKIREILSAGVILGSMGAVMDISVSIASALTELKDKAIDITKKELFDSGMRIGGDIIGTMVNTLVLAYIGSAVLSMLFIYLQKDQFPLIRILNFESIASDIIRAFAGSIGILISVPVTSYLCCKLFKKN